MKSLSRVVWSEGMHLAPHHFQAQARYFEDLIDFTATTVRFQFYGLLGFEFDAEAIRNGTIALVHARGVFPDGLSFYMPQSDSLPEPRNIVEVFPPSRPSLDVLLAIAPHKAGGVNCNLSETEGALGVRYTAELRSVADLVSGGDEKSVKLGRKNISVLLDTEISDETVNLPVARVIRDGSGNFAFDPTFVPPCLHISASPRLMELLQRLIGLLEQKVTAFTKEQGGGSGAAAGFSAQEIANAWLLHSVNSALSSLRHLWSAKEKHPETLYLELARLSGALCTFALDAHPRDLPLYDHEHLAECFEALDRHIRSHLELIAPTNCVAIPLDPVRDYFYAGEIRDQRVLGRSRWIFAIRSPIGEVELISRSPKLVKICSQEFIEKLVKRALPGMELRHVATPPAAVSPKVDTQYFSVDKSGPCWDHIVTTRKVAVYVPGDLPNPELQLLVVLDT